MYLIVKCSNCGVVQYVAKGQKTRKCPRCNKILKIETLNIFSKALTVQEASDIVRTMKTPSEVGQRIAKLKADTKSSLQSNHSLLGTLISELIAVFPNALPQEMLLQKAKELGIEEEFVETTLEHLNQQGLVLINTDSTNNKSHVILKFPSIPFKDGKLEVKKPIPTVKFRKNQWK